MTWYFQNWSGTGVTYQNATNTETAVVFNQTNATATAEYKGTRLSDNPDAFANNSQRKFVRTDNGDLHMVYEDNGKVWYERSADNGATWQLANNGKPLSGAYGGKLPAIDYKDNSISIIWQENYGGVYRIKLAEFGNGNLYRSGYIFTDYDLSYSYDANPVIALDGEGRTLAAWQRKDETPDGIFFWYGTISMFGVNTLDEGNLSNTNSNSINPTLATDKTYSIPSYYHLAWEQKSGSYSDIKYYKLYRDGYQNIQTSTSSPETPSSGGGFWTNARPSIIALDDNTPKLVWIGYAPWFLTRPVFRKKEISGSWSSFYSYTGGTVGSVNINRTDDNNYVFGWSNSSNENKYVKNSNLYGISNFSSTGKDIQVNNSADFNNMFCMAFQSNVTPHIFVKSGSVGGLQKTSFKAVNDGRAVVVRKDGADFMCAIGDILINGEAIGFVERKNIDQLKTRKELNKYITTKPFQLDDGSKLDLRIISGITNSDSARQVLKTDKFITFNIELVDAKTGETLYSFAGLEYSANSLKDSTGLSYTFNAKGLGKQMARVRVSLDENISGEYTILQLIGDDNVLPLSKQSSQEVFPEEALVITEFALGQNYPNPFNPTTQIVFDLPKAGEVTLTVYDMTGRTVATLVNGYKSAGRYDVTFDGTSLASGAYIYRLQAGKNFVETKKLLLVK